MQVLHLQSDSEYLKLECWETQSNSMHVHIIAPLIVRLLAICDIQIELKCVRHINCVHCKRFRFYIYAAYMQLVAADAKVRVAPFPDIFSSSFRVNMEVSSPLSSGVASVPL